ncbi:MAG: FHA domain-containing protein [Dehalococcoidia bacterium]
MPQPQGPRSFDPYRILQLQPHAARDLIVESYWTLVARAKSHGNDAAIRALNAAYELLTTAERRAEYDLVHRYVQEELPPPDKKKHKDGKNGAKAAPDHYTLLAVSAEADVDVIELSYRIGMRRAAGYRPELVLMREQLTDAFQTLSDPQARAQYDATLAVARSSNGYVAMPEPAEGTGAAPGVPDFLSKKNKPRGGDPESAPRRKRGMFGLFEKREKRPVDGSVRRDNRLPAPPTTKVAEETARGDRLLELRPFGAEVLAGAMRRPPAPEQPPMAVLSVRGPLGEERVPLPPRTITIGSSEENDIILPGKRVAPEQARMWPHGDSFALRVTGRGQVRVNGVEPMLAVVLLEDADIVDINEYRLTFLNAPRR